MRLRKREHELPKGAVYVENVSGGIALWDVSHLMPTGSKRRREKAAKRNFQNPRQRRNAGVRDGGPIDRFFVHHSGANGRSGFAGAYNSAEFVTRSKWLGGRGFPWAAYHLWISRSPLRDERGRLVVLQCADFDLRTWHTGTSKAADRYAHVRSANDRGIGCALQGNTTKQLVSEFQIECLEGLIPWALRSWEMPPVSEALSWHSISEPDGGSPKPECPGAHAEAWLELYKERAA